MTISQRNNKFMAFCLPERQRNIKALIREQKKREQQEEIKRALAARRVGELED